MPNSVNVPFQTLIHEQNGILKLKPPELLKEVFAGTTLDMSKPVAAMCGSGISSCVVVLGAYLAGKEDAALFDGSWQEDSIKMKNINPENIVKG